jgi:site-specific recombinase XerD
MALPSRNELPLSVVVRRYLSHRRQIDRLAPSTIQGYMIVLVNFSDVLGPIEVGRVKPRHVTKYVHEKSKGGLSTASLGAYLTRLKQFARWCLAEQYSPANFMGAAHHPRRPRSVPRGLTAQEVQATIDACETPRDRIICVLMWLAGLRCIEVSRLQRCDLDLDQGLMMVHGKGDHDRELPIVAELATELRRFLELEPIASSGWLIRSERDPQRPLSAKSISELVAEIFRRAGVKRSRYDGRSAHAYRHTLAIELLDNGVDARDAADILGHVDPSLVWNVYGKRHRSNTRLRAALETRG